MVKKWTLILFLLCISGCAQRNVNQYEDYLSITLTYEVEEEASDKLYSDLIVIPLTEIVEGTSKIETKLKHTIAYERDFPLAVYSEQKNGTYYSKANLDLTGNNIFFHDSKTKLETQLTFDFIYLSELEIISDDKIIIGGVREGSEDVNVQLYVYTHSEKKLENITNNEDLDIRSVHYDSDSDTIYATGRSISALRDRIENQSNDVDYTDGTAYIMVSKSGKLSPVAEVEKQEILDFIIVQKNIIYRTQEGHTRCKTLESKKELPCSPFLNLGQNTKYYEQGHLVFFVNDNKIIKLNLDTNEESVIFESKYLNSTISNFNLVKFN